MNSHKDFCEISWCCAKWLYFGGNLASFVDSRSSGIFTDSRQGINWSALLARWQHYSQRRSLPVNVLCAKHVAYALTSCSFRLMIGQHASVA